MKKILLILLCLPLIGFGQDRLYERLDLLYKLDKEKCLRKCLRKIKNKTDNPVPYIFALKCELGSINLDINSLQQENDLTIINQLRERVSEMSRYATMVERLSDEQLQCTSLYLADKIILENVIWDLDPIIEIHLPKRIKSFRNSYKRINFDGRTGYTVDTTFYFNGIATGEENILSSSEKEEIRFLDTLNKVRIDQGLHPLKLNQDLSRAARYHSYDMATQSYFEHDSYDRKNECSGLEKVASFNVRLQQFSSHGSGENITAGSNDAYGAYTSWYNSPGHYENMFNKDYTSIGIGYISVPGSIWEHYWTTTFGKK